ncbi:heme exporter protein CcmD [Pasteurella skyensis]|uniref:Heme exporter protein D n=1 Tax=Phocoenobacter skyensis TaxID=97481 RepID=A0AAJ6P195_9PAST|nr:heme exporter protein CcmD [Pasteurella skyensis]MDP8163306.1 heme exporter protein CcmD [Pasteurella skyensis]MDP8173507.1 heme exporter protein CcmD [Pasteurella skyensis]MDP8177264.1 heme exporter protein CcmD [Pasteurella skyensis]MDP8179764.1 heme exporter protein CcmD [Pasteurella skyensis]MDP8183878.1 heme exporter protein CcmD [Pasteurella skyensis]
MFFQSWSDFFNMGGYGFYVWLAYGISFLAILVLGLQSIISKKTLFKEIKREQERKQRQQNTRGSL